MTFSVPSPSWRPLLTFTDIGADFWKGDATKHVSVKKKGIFSEKGGGNSMNEGFGKDSTRKTIQ